MSKRKRQKGGAMIPNILTLLQTAIRERRKVAVRYHDQGDTRVVEPHALYRSDNDELLMDGFQIDGYSSSGRPPPFWRPFRLKKIRTLSVLTEIFEPRYDDGYSPNKVRYRSGMIACVGEEGAAAPYSYMTPAHEMGPHPRQGTHRLK